MGVALPLEEVGERAADVIGTHGHKTNQPGTCADPRSGVAPEVASAGVRRQGALIRSRARATSTARFFTLPLVAQ